MSENETASRLEPITVLIELLEECYTGTMPTIRQVDAAASSAKFPVKRINGRRYVDRVNLPLIAGLYGLTPKAKPPVRRKGTNTPVSAAA